MAASSRRCTPTLGAPHCRLGDGGDGCCRSIIRRHAVSRQPRFMGDRSDRHEDISAAPSAAGPAPTVCAAAFASSAAAGSVWGRTLPSWEPPFLWHTGEQQGNNILDNALTMVMAEINGGVSRRPILGAASVDVQGQLDAGEEKLSGAELSMQRGSPFPAEIKDEALSTCAKTVPGGSHAVPRRGHVCKRRHIPGGHGHSMMLKRAEVRKESEIGVVLGDASTRTTSSKG